MNVIVGSWPYRKIMEGTTGIDARRRFPRCTSRSLGRWFAGRRAVVDNPIGRVVLFDDTYMNCFEPHIGMAAVALLESCGYEVILAHAGCCQRHRIALGFLREAKVRGESTLRNLDTYVQQGLKIVVCEPSCCSALVDDLPDLVDDVELGNRIRGNVMMIDDFLAREHKAGKITRSFVSAYTDVLIQGHCHQKALFGTTAMKYLLDLIPGMSVTELEAGCCGMGDFYGYEKAHYDFSMKIGEDRLFPLIRGKSDGAIVVACGFHCRTQIADGTGVRALHWVETLRGTD